MKRVRTKRWLAAVLATIVAAAFALGGCSGGKEEPNQSSEAPGGGIIGDPQGGDSPL